MFNTLLAAATGGAAIASFMNDSVAHLGFGIEGLTATPAIAGALTSYNATFTSRGKAGSIAFAETALVFGDTNADGDVADAGEKAPVINQGETVNGAVPNAKLWTVTITLDGPDTDTDAGGADTDTDVTALVARFTKVVTA